MATARGSGPRLRVRINPHAWAQEVERYAQGSQARVAGERERPRLERDGLAVRQLLPCEEVGLEGARLGGLVKAYVPISDDPPSRRLFGFVLAPRPDPDGPYLALVAFGERHPEPGTRSVYERAHKRLHGRYPDQ